MRPSPAQFLLAILAASHGAAADPAAIDPGAFTVTLDRITLSRSISFSNGDLAHGTSSEQSSLQLRLTYDDVHIIDFGVLRCDSALTDAGEDLALSTPEDTVSVRMMLKQFRRLSMMSGEKPYVPLSFSLHYPSKPATSLTRFKATVEAICETGPGENIDLTPAGDWVGKKRDLPGSAEGFTILALAPLKYVCDQAVSEERAITSVVFLDEHGTEIQSSGWGGTGDGKRTTVTRSSLNLDPQGTVRITLVGKTTRVTIPVDLTDIPLQAPRTPSVAAPAPVAPTAPAGAPSTGTPSKDTDF